MNNLCKKKAVGSFKIETLDGKTLILLMWLRLMEKNTSD